MGCWGQMPVHCPLAVPSPSELQEKCRYSPREPLLCSGELLPQDGGLKAGETWAPLLGRWVSNFGLL